MDWGSYDGGYLGLSAGSRKPDNPASEGLSIPFRVATVPESSTLALDALGILGCLRWPIAVDRAERTSHGACNLYALIAHVGPTMGSITKEGSALARFLLGQMVLHVLRRDGTMRAWYRGIKKRRGSKIARVAVMQRSATVLWHMVKHNEAYVVGGPPRNRLATAG